MIGVLTERCGPSSEPSGGLQQCLGHIPESKSSAATESLRGVTLLRFELCLQLWFFEYTTNSQEFWGPEERDIFFSWRISFKKKELNNY